LRLRVRGVHEKSNTPIPAFLSQWACIVTGGQSHSIDVNKKLLIFKLKQRKDKEHTRKPRKINERTNERTNERMHRPPTSNACTIHTKKKNGYTDTHTHTHSHKERERERERETERETMQRQRTNGRTDEQTNERTNERTNEHTGDRKTTNTRT